MKLVDRKTFMTLPAGIVYAEYEPCIMGPLLIKGKTIQTGLENTDWFYDCIEAPSFDANGDTARFDYYGYDYHGSSRDGGFDDKQRYAVFERGDVRALIERLQAAEASAFGAKK